MFEVRFVNSTAIKLIGYNRQTQTLRIIFQDSKGNVTSGYDYPHTPEREFLKLANAPSVGKRFQPMRDVQHSRLSSEEAHAFYSKAIDAMAATRVVI